MSSCNILIFISSDDIHLSFTVLLLTSFGSTTGGQGAVLFSWENWGKGAGRFGFPLSRL